MIKPPETLSFKSENRSQPTAAATNREAASEIAKENALDFERVYAIESYY